jgi:3-phenylpropionate/trans-cinnamate dioxygenase ferredoxin component
MAEFLTVAKAGDIADNECIAVDADGTAVAIANVGGTFYAFDDTCTHRQCSLAEGELDGTVITCPCHGSQFDVTTGDVVAAPAVEPVSTYPLRMEGDTIEIEI